MKNLFYKDLPVFRFKIAEDFHNWFLENHTREEGFWLRYYKKGTNKHTILHDQAVDEALCWGWIDGLGNKYDNESWVVRYTPRRAKSVWSKINVAKVEKLIVGKRMQPGGQKQVDAAKADGRWEAAYEGQSTIAIPKEFISLVKTVPEAWEFYQSLNKANKYTIAYRISTTVGKEKKHLKIKQLFKMMINKKKFH
jgi:uncharacterized protein YdeI (YjbR/CyaY-like superfamily)